MLAVRNGKETGLFECPIECRPDLASSSQLAPRQLCQVRSHLLHALLLESLDLHPNIRKNMEKKKQSVVTVVRTTAASLIWQSARPRKIVYGLANTRAVNGIQERIESAKVSGDNLVEKLYYVIPTEGGYRNS